MGWENDLERIKEFLSTPDYASADQWVKSHDADGLIHYGFSKQAVGAYVALQAFEFLKRGVRINAICPGLTDTPLARANADLWLSFGEDYREAIGIQVHQPEQMGNAMAFINSPAASGVNGITLIVDSGHDGVAHQCLPARQGNHGPDHRPRVARRLTAAYGSKSHL
jgi:NAD(P)-dependent dehydrogenase (short-subunit alcohol dehydrogenase family)